jgi:cyanophycin synthetase
MQEVAGESQPFVCSLRPLQGCGYGLRQKVMVGTIQVDPALSSRLDEMMLAAQELCSGSSFYSPAWENPTQCRAVEKVIYIYFLLQQCVKIPVFEEYRLSPEAAHSRCDRADVSAISSCRLVLPYWTVAASQAVLSWMFAAVTRVQDRPDVGDLLMRIGPMGLYGTNAYPFLRAGWQRGIHTGQLVGRVMQFGLGAQSRWLDSSMTDRTSAIGLRLSKKKNLTNRLLSQFGFPVPKQMVVNDLPQARRAAAQLGMPVVIKPLDQDQGRGVCVGLADDDEIEQAFQSAAAYGPAVIVEECCQGRDYRLTVFQDALVKVMQRTPLSVVGDGRSSIAELLDRKRQEVHRLRGPALNKDDPYAVDSEILRTIRRQGYGLDAVPPEDRIVPLRGKANLSAGGSQALVPLASVHPDNIRLAISLTSLLRLDCCGIDLLIADIRQSWLQVGCHIIELNAQPQIGVDHAPEVYGQILQQLLPDPAPSLSLILDAFGSEPSSCLTSEHPIVQRLCAEGAAPVVVASSTHLWRESQLIQVSPQSPGAAIQAALQDPAARSLILIMSVADCLARGLPTHRIDRIVCVISNPGDAAQAAQLDGIRVLAPEVPLSLVTP